MNNLKNNIEKVLIIGGGSAGKKHISVIKNLKENIKIELINSYKTFILFDLLKYNPDLIIISSPTYSHIDYLKIIDKKFKKKIILVEKPLFKKYTNFKKNLKNNNKIFVSYNLRFHPLIKFLKKFLKDKKIFFVKSFCMSYLPNWRKKDYTKTYSASKKLGGGVSLDLSHELDYLRWLFGEIEVIFKKNDKISNLKINSDDVFNLIGKTNKRTMLNLTLSYASRVEKRVIIADGNNFSLYGDLNSGLLEIIYGNKLRKIKFRNIEQKMTMKLMYRSLLKRDFKTLGTLNDGKKILKILG